MDDSKLSQHDLILMVDDNPENLQVLGNLLISNGYEVDAISDSNQVMGYLENHKPDLIILDIIMPDIDGLELCKLIKQEKYAKDIPVLFITAYGLIEYQLEAFDVGAVDFITKPFKNEIILARVNTHLALGKMRRHMEKLVKKRTAQLEILLREIHHRVRNNLQVVAGILNLQILREKDKRVKELLIDNQNRILSMGMVHKRIYNSNNYSHLDLKVYLKSLIHDINRLHEEKSDNISFITAIENIMLPLDQAMPVAMVLEELINNCYKHAFPDNRKGKIIITFKKLEGNYQLRLENNGIPFDIEINLTKPSSFGYDIITNLVKQIYGTISVESDDRTIITITFPEIIEE